MARLFIISGEPSGDLHGSNLVKALLKERPELEIRCWGGDRMQEAGAEVVKHIDDLAFMGFIEVVSNLGTILKNFKLCTQQIKEFQPDLVVFIDYPGFNLRMAKRVKKLGIPTAYYISPQIWAWKESRVSKVKHYIDHVFVILPFEKAFYNKHGVKAEYVGHPLLDELQHVDINPQNFREKHGLHPTKPIISLLPGSRKQEIERLITPLSRVIDAFKDHQFVVSKVSWQPNQLYGKLPKRVHIVEGNTYKLLKASEAAIVTSGTATLETALLNTPQVVVYKANALSVIIARALVKVKFISLVNLIMDRKVVKELIQSEVNATNLKKELQKVIVGGANREKILQDYEQLRTILGEKGTSEFVAKRLLKIIQTT